MVGRQINYRSSCPPLVLTRLQQLPSSQILLLQEKGCAAFVLKDLANNKKFNVALGEVHSCTCAESRSELCIHILFVLSKLFRIPASNPLLFQRSLLDAEVNDLVFARNRERKYQKEALRAAALAAQSAASSSGGVKQEIERKPIDTDTDCPICCCSLLPDDFQEHEQQQDQEETTSTTAQSQSQNFVLQQHMNTNLVYCKYGCGNNIHIECFRQYVAHHATKPEPLCCMLCREKWSNLTEEDVGDLPRYANGVSCDHCHEAIVYGQRFRCSFCSRYDLCPRCYFQKPQLHCHHPFNVQESTHSVFVPAPSRPQRTIINNSALAAASAGAETIRRDQNQQQQQQEVTPTRSNNSRRLEELENLFASNSPFSSRNTRQTIIGNDNASNNNNQNSPRTRLIPRLSLQETMRLVVPFEDALANAEALMIARYADEQEREQQELENNNSSSATNTATTNNNNNAESLLSVEMDTACAICTKPLRRESEFSFLDNNSNNQHQTNVLQVPNCLHAFHISCGTSYFVHGSARCCVCNSDVVPPPPPPAPAVAQSSSSPVVSQSRRVTNSNNNASSSNNDNADDFATFHIGNSFQQQRSTTTTSSNRNVPQRPRNARNISNNNSPRGRSNINTNRPELSLVGNAFSSVLSVSSTSNQTSSNSNSNNVPRGNVASLLAAKKRLQRDQQQQQQQNNNFSLTPSVQSLASQSSSSNTNNNVGNRNQSTRVSSKITRGRTTTTTTTPSQRTSSNINSTQNNNALLEVSGNQNFRFLPV